MAVPLTTHTQPAATLLCWTSVPRERRGQRGPSSGHRVRRGDRVARGTAAQGAHRLPCTLRFRCLSIRSFGLPPLPASAQPAPNLRTSDEAACTPAEVRLRPPREEPEPGGGGARVSGPSPPHPTRPTGPPSIGSPFPQLHGGTPHKSKARHPQDPLPGDPGPARPRRSHFRRPFPLPAHPLPQRLALKARGCARR